MMLLEAYNEEQIKDLAQRIVRITGEDSTLQLRGRYDFEGALYAYEYCIRVQIFHIGMSLIRIFSPIDNR